MKEKTIQISDLISQINKELVYAQSKAIGEPRIELKSVTLEVSTITYQDLLGKIMVGILPANFNVSGEEETSLVRKLKITLFPPEPSILKSANNIIDSLELGKTIVSSREQIQKGLLQAPNLSLGEMEIEVNFGIVEKSSGTGKISIYVFAVNGNYEMTKNNLHSIKMVFESDVLP